MRGKETRRKIAHGEDRPEGAQQQKQAKAAGEYHGEGNVGFSINLWQLHM